MFNFFAVFLIDLGSKYADSNNIFFVSNSVPDRVPPIIPPNPSIPLLSLITLFINRVYNKTVAITAIC